jgi:hypothetical protein
MSGDEERLRGELSAVLDLIRGVGGGVVFEEFPEPLEDASGADMTSDDRAVMRRALIEQANNLAETLERMRPGEKEI